MTVLTMAPTPAAARPPYPPAITGKVYIYAPVDPRTDAVRYVGKARNLRLRIAAHLTPFGLSRKTRKTSWLKSILRIGLRPSYRVLEIVDEALWAETERKHIANQLAMGARLTNSTDGGDGSLGHTPSSETLEKMARAHRGRKHRPESIARMSETQRGRVVSDHTRKLLSDALKGRPLPEAVAAKVRIAKTGKKVSEESREKMRRAQAGYMPSPATIEAARKHNTGRTLSADHVEKMRIANTGRKPSDATKRLMSKNRTGIPVSDEARQRMRSAALARVARTKAGCP